MILCLKLTPGWWKQTAHLFIRNCHRVWRALWIPSVCRSGAVTLAWVWERESGRLCEENVFVGCGRVTGFRHRKKGSSFQGLWPCLTFPTSRGWGPCHHWQLLSSLSVYPHLPQSKSDSKATQNPSPSVRVGYKQMNTLEICMWSLPI